jgi:hypothetical protein
MIPFFLMTKEEKKRRNEWREREKVRRLKDCVDWDPKMKFDEELNLTASSWQPRDFFPEVEPGPEDRVGPYLFAKGEQYYAESPSGLWRYSKPTISRGTKLDTYYSNKRGTVMWDGPVVCPAVHRRPHYGPKDLWKQTDQQPYMSMTPMEIMTLRGGTRRAKGHVIVAGLGLGYQLIDVSNRKKVNKLTLIELDQELIDWLYPRIQPHLGMEVEVVVGNAYELLPDMTADVVLLDTFKGYGGNDWERDKVRRTGNFGFVWAWGTQHVNGSSGYW